MAEPKSPVICGLENYEVVFGENQEGVSPLPALRCGPPGLAVMSRWELTDEERRWIAEGADVFVSVITGGGRPQPISVQICGKEQDPAYAKDALALDQARELMFISLDFENRSRFDPQRN